MSHRNRKPIRRALAIPFEWLAIFLGLLVFAWMPRNWLLKLCDMLSVVYYFFDHRGKRRALENLHIIRGTCNGVEGTRKYDPDSAEYRPHEREAKIIRRAYRNMSRTIGHIFWTSLNARRRAAVAAELSKECRDFLRANRPAITVSAHLGCWEVLSQLAFLEGHSMISVAKDIGSGGMTKLLMRARKSIGQEIVPADGAFKPLLKGIRSGMSLGLLVDQKVGTKKGGIWIRFLGKPMPVSAAPAYFATKLKLPIVVAWSRPLADGRYRCEFISTPALPAGEANSSAVDPVWTLTQKIADDIGRVIKRHPSCWILSYNYFRDYMTPEEEAEFNTREREAAK